MRKLLLIWAFLIGCNVALGQGTGNTVTIPVTSAQSGACAFVMMANDITNGNLYWCDQGTFTKLNGAGGTNNPGGSNTDLQYNVSGTSFGGSANLTWVSPTLTVGASASATGVICLQTNTASGACINLQNGGATTAWTLALPAAIPATNDIFSCVVSSTTCTLTDTGILSTALVTAGSNFTNAAMVVAAGANKTTTSWADFTVSSHTGSMGASGIMDLSAATGTAAFKVPSNSTNTATAAGAIDFDTTNKNFHVYANGADSIMAASATALGPTNGHCVNWVVATGNLLLGDAGSTCGGSISFPQTVGGTTTSGGVPYFSSTTVLTSSALLATNALVVGGGAGGAPATGNGDFTYATHTMTSGASGILDLHAATGTAAFKVPSNTSNTASAAGVIDFDSTANNYHIYANGADAIVAPFASAPSNGDCIQATVSGGNVLLSDSGTSNCGGGGATALSAITAATAAHTIASSTHVDQIWNWAPTANSHVNFEIGETTAATNGTLGNQYGFETVTLAGSTAVPLNVTCSLTGSQTLPCAHITPTWNTTGVVDAALLVNVTNTASGTASLLEDLQIGGTSEFKVDKAGNTTANGSVIAGGSVGLFEGTEGTCSGAASSVDVLCADATLHAFKSSLNNGSFVAIPQLAGDLGGTAASPTVTNGSHITNASIPNTGLVNTATTPNGQTCTLGSTCNVNSGAAAHSVALNEGAGSAIAGAAIGTGGRLLIDQGASADPSFNAMSQDCTITTGGVITCTKSNNVALGQWATATGAINPQTSTYQVLAADFTNLKTITVASGTFTITLVASGSQPAAGQYIDVINYGSGVVTIARSGQNINGGTASIVLESASATVPSRSHIISDGTNYFASADFGNPMTTAGDIIYAGTTGLPTRLATGTAKQILTAGSPPAYIDFPDVKIIPAANCVSTVAGAGWNTALTPGCIGGSNNLGGELPFADASTAQFEYELPVDWDTANQPYIAVHFLSNTNTSGTVIFQAAVACYKSDGSTTSDPAFNTADVMTTKTMAAATRGWSTSVQSTQVTSGNSCVPGGTMLVKITRNTDTAAAVVWVTKAVITTPRLLTVQAN